MKKLVVIAIVVVVVGVIADSALRTWAGNKVAGEMQSALDLSEEPKVAIEGFPFVLDVLGGRLEAITVSEAGLESDGVTLSNVSITLRNVRISLPDLIDGKLGGVRVGSGRGTATLRAVDLAAALGQEGLDVGAIDPGEFSVSGNTLSVGPSSVELPEIVDGMTYERVEVSGDGVALTFALDRTVLDLSGG